MRRSRAVARQSALRRSTRCGFRSRGARAAPCAGCSRAASATARGTGALKRSTSGRSGRQGDCAFSRSQLNSARKRGRTFHSKRCARRDTSCGCPVAATPGPHTRRTPASAGKGRWQASSNMWRGSASRARWRSNCSRTGAFDQAHRHALAHAFDLAPGRALHAGGIGCAVQAQQEMLVFLDARARVGLHRHHHRRAGGKAELGGAVERAAQRLERRGDPQCAACAGGQHLGQVIDPDAVAGPARVAGWRGAPARQREGCRPPRVAGRHHGFVEAHHHLAHLGHFAHRRNAGHPRRQGRAGHAGQTQPRPEPGPAPLPAPVAARLACRVPPGPAFCPAAAAMDTGRAYRGTGSSGASGAGGPARPPRASSTIWRRWFKSWRSLASMTEASMKS